ncbi:hypothetical protein O6H91_23G041700 [Diphasiastrum complanatum]|uniref:Uncharacterized protein n=1 Tax=Diphasiastrum complanatum TaxID=34168 RepID=A0ACC2AA25_DIPCM|nr:hypothetical protein O6H91_23G041700 [Diphasiastrum complanatum]
MAPIVIMQGPGMIQNSSFRCTRNCCCYWYKNCKASVGSQLAGFVQTQARRLRSTTLLRTTNPLLATEDAKASESEQLFIPHPIPPYPDSERETSERERASADFREESQALISTTNG